MPSTILSSSSFNVDPIMVVCNDVLPENLLALVQIRQREQQEISKGATDKFCYDRNTENCIETNGGEYEDEDDRSSGYFTNPTTGGGTRANSDRPLVSSGRGTPFSFEDDNMMTSMERSLAAYEDDYGNPCWANPVTNALRFHLEEPLIRGQAEAECNELSAEIYQEIQKCKSAERPRPHPPPGYVCHKCRNTAVGCGSGGGRVHWIQDCPLRYVQPSTTPYEGSKPCYGEYHCPKCKRAWWSDRSYAHASKTCNKCNIRVFPKKQLKIEDAIRLGKMRERWGGKPVKNRRY